MSATALSPCNPQQRLVMQPPHPPSPPLLCRRVVSEASAAAILSAACMDKAADAQGVSNTSVSLDFSDSWGAELVVQVRGGCGVSMFLDMRTVWCREAAPSADGTSGCCTACPRLHLDGEGDEARSLHCSTARW